MTAAACTHLLCMVSLGILMVLAAACLLRCILGPRISDRILAVNMIGTLVIIMIAVLTVALAEGYLVDVALVYALISFVAVVLLCKVYTGIYRERKHEEARLRGEDPDAAIDVVEADEREARA